LAKEWAIEGIKTSVTDDGNGVWWVVANLVCLDFLGIEDVISQVVQMVSPTSESKDLSDAQSLELLSSVCGLLCAESGVKLHLSLTVTAFHYISYISLSCRYKLFAIESPPMIPVCGILQSCSARY